MTSTGTARRAIRRPSMMLLLFLAAARLSFVAGRDDNRRGIG
jgi:hypothetical protein